MPGPESNFRKALKLHGEGDHEAASRLYAQVLEADPGHANARLNLASIAFDAGRFDEAMRLCDEALASGAQSPAAELILSRIAYLRGDHAAGFAHICNAHRLAPGDDSITYEYAAAVRRHYWTFRPQEYSELFTLAQETRLPPEYLQRLCHQAFARLVRPQLIELIAGKDGQELTDDPILPLWGAMLDETGARDLELLVRNFRRTLSVMHSHAPWRPRTARLTLRDGSMLEVKELADIDPLAAGSLEVVGDDGETMFFPFGDIRWAEFDRPAVNVSISLLCRNGTQVRGYVPLLYLFSEFSPDPQVREGRVTYLRKLDDDLRLPIGMREWRSNARLMPMVNVRRVDFRD